MRDWCTEERKKIKADVHQRYNFQNNQYDNIHHNLGIYE